jgi:hypothetical protein
MLDEKLPALASTIPGLERLISKWKQMASIHPDYAPWISEGLKYAAHYYRRLDDTRTHVIALCKHGFPKCPEPEVPTLICIAHSFAPGLSPILDQGQLGRNRD